MSRCRYEGNELCHGLVLVEQLGVESLLGKCDLGVGQSLVEFVLNTFVL